MISDRLVIAFLSAPLPADRIKIDRSFMSEVATQPNAAAVVQASSAWRAALAGCVAEGVEDAAQLDYLKSQMRRNPGLPVQPPAAPADVLNLLRSVMGPKAPGEI
jgi:predicted signal transduction protein with EAL and GGDEF domain